MSISPGFKIGGSKSDRQVAPRRLVVWLFQKYAESQENPKPKALIDGQPNRICDNYTVQLDIFSLT